MNNKKILDFFDKIMDPDLGNIVISKQEDGYTLFNRFYVKQHTHSFYEVVDITTNTIEEFSSLKHAIAYVTLINCKKYHLARRLSRLDLKLSSLDMDLKVSKNLYRNKEHKEIQWLKFHDTSYNRKMLIHEINEIIASAKSYQRVKFSSAGNKRKFKYWG